MSLESIEKEYRANSGLYESLCREMATQIGEVLQVQGIPLASPLDYRVKTWTSITGKVQRSGSEPQRLADIPDVAGIRIIALFRRDIARINGIVESSLVVIEKEDTSGRLAEDQFGYGSIHYHVRAPDEWLKVPTLRKFEGLCAEIQLRTASQHIWAAASHVLQYKKEAHVPVPLRRSINRAAALLETIDLELDRFLHEREEYAVELRPDIRNLPLNTESLRQVLDEMLPTQNRDQSEDYAALVDELLALGVKTTGRLRELIERHLAVVMKEDRQQVQRCADQLARGEVPLGSTPERVRAGAYFTHVGLTRGVLQEEFGKDVVWSVTMRNRSAAR